MPRTNVNNNVTIEVTDTADPGCDGIASRARDVHARDCRLRHQPARVRRRVGPLGGRIEGERGAEGPGGGGGGPFVPPSTETAVQSNAFGSTAPSYSRYSQTGQSSIMGGSAGNAVNTVGQVTTQAGGGSFFNAAGNIFQSVREMAGSGFQWVKDNPFPLRCCSMVSATC